VPAHWTIREEDIGRVIDVLEAEVQRGGVGGVPEEDAYKHAKLVKHDEDVYIRIHPLNPSTLNQTAADWASHRAFLDELFPIVKQRVRDAERRWSDADRPRMDEVEKDSYYGWDLSEWRNVHGEVEVEGVEAEGAGLELARILRVE
jgi:hypothetical protein